MQQHYGLTVDDIFSMSWRRFAVLFRGIFSWNEGDDASAALLGSVPDKSGGVKTNMSKYDQSVHEARGADSKISRSMDWDSALGKARPDKKSFVTTSDLMGGIHGGSRN